VLAFHQLADNSLTGWFKWLYWNQMDAAPLWQGRPTSVFLGVNSLAAHVNMVIPFALGFQMSRKFGSGLRIVARLCFCLSIVVLVLTLSRGAFIAFFFMMAIAFRTLLRDSGKRWKWIGAIALALAAGAAISYFAVQAADRSGGVSNAERLGGMDEVTMFRAVLYAAAWEMFLSSPVLGIGYGNFREHFAGSGTVNTDTVWDAHSLYFKYLAEIGLAGTVCFLGYIWIVVRGGLRSWREGKSDMERVIGAALVGSVATVMVQGLVESLIENPPFGSLLWLLFALWAVSSRIPPEENNSFLVRETASHGA
jgi:O-antigen ligase